MTAAVRCANCGGDTVDRFCAACGQRRITEDDLTLRGFFHESFHELTSLDGRLFTTLRVLVAKPGLLAREYFEGRGTRYMKPLSLFVLMNLVFFIIQPHTGLMRYDLANYIDYDGDVASRRRDFVNDTRVDLAFRAKGNAPGPAEVQPLRVFRVRFDDTLQDLKKSMLIVSIPLFALALAVLYAGTHHRFAEHLVFSVHVYAFFLLFAGVFVTPAFFVVFSVLSALGIPAATLAPLGSERALIAALFVVMGGYIFLALRRFYGSRPLTAALRAVPLFVVMQALIVAYHDVLFFATLYSL